MYMVLNNRFLVQDIVRRYMYIGNTLIGHAQQSQLKLYSVVCGNKIILVISHIHYAKATVYRCNFIKCFVKFKVYVIKMLCKIKSDKTTWCVGLQNDNYSIH